MENFLAVIKLIPWLGLKYILFCFQVMKDWSDLEDKYQEMRDKDPSAAEDFKKKMTERFQKTVQALEEESQAEKRQIQAMHQQVGSQQLP